MNPDNPIQSSNQPIDQPTSSPDILQTGVSTEQQPISPPTGKPTPTIAHEIQKKKSKIIIVAIIVLILTSLTSFGVWAYQNYLASPKPIPEAGIPSHSPAPAPTADWKTYTNTEYKFSFKYPSDWDILDMLGHGLDTRGSPVLMIAPQKDINTANKMFQAEDFTSGKFITSILAVFEGGVVKNRGNIGMSQNQLYKLTEKHQINMYL